MVEEDSMAEAGARPRGVCFFFVANQHLDDGSAHAFYCLRRCLSMADADPSLKVVLLAPKSKKALQVDLLASGVPPNFSIIQLPSWRRERGGRGMTINIIFHTACLIYLLLHSRRGDFVITASFSKLFQFLFRWADLRRRLQWVYEVHQLSELDSNFPHGDPQYEIVRSVDMVFTTTPQLQAILESRTQREDIFCLGLACSFHPETFPPPSKTFPPIDSNGVISIGYVGSVYKEQGVHWLVEAWPQLCARIKNPLRLEIIGGNETERASLERLSGMNPSVRKTERLFHGWVSPSLLPERLESIDILVLPSLNVGRMPYVAITKAYDYLAFNRPIIAADLESIQSVLIPGRHALFFEGGNIDSLAAAILALQAGGKLLVDALTGACREKALELSWERHTRAFLERCRVGGGESPL